jgi:hypothetical protein
MLVEAKLSPQTPGEIKEWLQKSGLLQDKTVIDVTVIPARRPSHLVTLSDGTSLFLKRIAASDTSQFFHREVDFMKLASTEEELTPFWQVMPELFHYDEHSGLLVTEGLTHYKTFGEYCGSHPMYDRAILMALGLFLARCHITSIHYKEHAVGDTRLHLRPPVPTYGHITPTQFAYASGRDFPIYLTVVQSINEALRTLKNNWTSHCLIHGDFKGDNIMLHMQAASEGTPAIKFIDWELAGWGDPLWDVGSFIGQLLLYWAMSIQPTGGDNFASWISNASVPFETVQSSIACFTSSYIYSWQAALQDMESQQTKIMQYAGLFLLHRALASLALAGNFSPSSYCCLHLGRTLISRPMHGVKLLFPDISFKRLV